ncbi:hypothetical protein [Longimonas sp.]|uniref:hypothetical protein n=1 Tax=Longimonas sp. TaxID=2039626 RepID=UPI0039766E74
MPQFGPPPGSDPIFPAFFNSFPLFGRIATAKTRKRRRKKMKNKIVLLVFFLFGAAVLPVTGAEANNSITGFELVDPEDDTVVADVHKDHWHGSLSLKNSGDDLSLGALVTASQGDKIHLDGKNSKLEAFLAPGAKEGVVALESTSISACGALCGTPLVLAVPLV